MTTERRPLDNLRLGKLGRTVRRPSKARVSRIAVTGASVSAVLALTAALGQPQPVTVEAPLLSGELQVAPVVAGAGLTVSRIAPGMVAATPAQTITRQSVAVTRSGGSR